VSDVAYARAGETHIAYRVVGEPGRVDIVMVASALFPFELLVEDRVASRFMAGLAALGRLVVFDKRGVGLSDPMTDWARSAQEQWAEDLVAVTEAAALTIPLSCHGSPTAPLDSLHPRGLICSPRWSWSILRSSLAVS